jgi:hypothetical protein
VELWTLCPADNSGHARILPRCTLTLTGGVLGGLLSFARDLVVLDLLVVCWQDRCSTSRSERAGGPLQ